MNQSRKNADLSQAFVIEPSLNSMNKTRIIEVTPPMCPDLLTRS
uniref:Uncharacterized protein n=1 Tax=Moniliophthora roreri TaxID=221103 RepID=A0A0W0GDG4_MONRR